LQTIRAPGLSPDIVTKSLALEVAKKGVTVNTASSCL
jgi:hypothetical protein